jgi:tRNA(His) 5'-end guanylyltransferase
MNDSLGDRMKAYESASSNTLPSRIPLIMRLDGRAFHTYTRKMEKPFDLTFIKRMQETALYLCDEIDGAQIAYIQSDEISIFIHNYKKITTNPWFSNRAQKMVSISAAMASVMFSHLDEKAGNEFTGQVFDARVFIVPENDVANYFLWRQKDATKNSIQMLARSLYSNKELYKKNTTDLQEMCFQKGHNWNDLATTLKRGSCIIKNSEWVIDNDIPIFSADRKYIEKHLIYEK